MTFTTASKETARLPDSLASEAPRSQLIQSRESGDALPDSTFKNAGSVAAPNRARPEPKPWAHFLGGAYVHVVPVIDMKAHNQQHRWHDIGDSDLPPGRSQDPPPIRLLPSATSRSPRQQAYSRPILLLYSTKRCISSVGNAAHAQVDLYA